MGSSIRTSETWVTLDFINNTCGGNKNMDTHTEVNIYYDVVPSVERRFRPIKNYTRTKSLESAKRIKEKLESVEEENQTYTQYSIYQVTEITTNIYEEIE